MEAHSQKSSGLNLNPLAPAQSKRTFAFSGKIPESLEMHPFQLPFSFLFCTFFETFREKPKKGSRVRPQAQKIRQNGPQGRQNGAQESTIYVPRSHQVQTPAAGCSPKAT